MQPRKRVDNLQLNMSTDKLDNLKRKISSKTKQYNKIIMR